jgi:hypothetical protein
MEEIDVTAQTPDLATMVTRLEKLEQDTDKLTRQNRRLKLGGAVLALLTLLALASSLELLNVKQLWSSRTVTATQFLLQDESGKQRASWRLSAGEPVIEFLGPYGTPRLEMGAYRDQSRLTLYEANGSTQVAFTTGKERPGIIVGDVTSRLTDTRVASLGVGEEGPKLLLADVRPVAGRYITVERASLSVEKDGSHLRLFDAKGKPTFSKP